MAKLRISVSIDERYLKALDKIAEIEVRDRSNVVEMIIVKYIREHYPNLLPPEGPKFVIPKDK
jgi:metal-responsive CopG/Arc/MetJ family transcriptional regulator